jgi:hypothetical protein
MVLLDNDSGWTTVLWRVFMTPEKPMTDDELLDHSKDGLIVYIRELESILAVSEAEIKELEEDRGFFSRLCQTHVKTIAEKDKEIIRLNRMIDDAREVITAREAEIARLKKEKVK